MNGGLADKIGNRYEEDYVVLQCLRILVGETDSVEWERRGEEDGVDLRVTRAGRSAAIQCKHRSTRMTWTLRNLASGPPDRSVLAYARRALETDPRAEFRLVTDVPATDLDRLTDAARAVDSPEQWKDTKPGLIEQLVGGLGGGHVQAIHEIARRIRVEIIGPPALSEQLRSLARALLGSEPDRLIDCVRRVARAHLGRGPITRQHLEDAVRDDDLVLLRVDPSWMDRLTRLQVRYRAELEEVRELAVIPRPQSIEAAEAILEDRADVVVVHGPAGSGKSEVLLGALDRLMADGRAVLPLTPDRLGDGTGDLGPGVDPLGALVRHAGAEEPVLLIDQLDTVLWAGGSRRPLLNPVRDLLRQAEDLRLPVLIGCRTVDAEHETQLRNMIRGSGRRQVTRIAMTDLEESEYSRVLADAGMALLDLPPGLRRLAARPILLRLMRRVLERGRNLGDIRGWPDLFDAWWKRVSAELQARGFPDALASFDQLLERMGREGRLSARTGGLIEPGVLAVLAELGVVVLDDRGPATVARATHQLLVDTRIASSWADVAGPSALMARLRSREEQGVVTGGRLRLAIPFLRARSWFVDGLEAIVTSPDVRPLVKHALWLALGEIEDPRARERAMLVRWLRRDGLGSPALGTVVRGNADWVEAVDREGWIDEVWSTGSAEDRDIILGVLASVAQQWGDGVASKLCEWVKDDPEVLRRADWVFSHEPGRDTDALFELRRAALERGEIRPSPIDWGPLLQSSPERAFALLAAHLRLSDLDSLRDDEIEWATLFPTSDDPNLARVQQVEPGAWPELREWWLALDLEDLGMIRPPGTGLPESILVRIVEVLSHSLAGTLARGITQWRDLVADLPSPTRPVDVWLLLRTGAVITTLETAVADEAIEWFISDEAHARVDLAYRSPRLKLASEFVARVSQDASDRTYAVLETWIADYRDHWSAEDERRRLEWSESQGQLLPNLRGETAFHLLPALPVERRGERAIRLLLQLERKFGDCCETLWPDRGPRGGSIHSKVPDEVAARWTSEDWLRQLAEAPEHGTWTQVTPNSAVSAERDVLERQLVRIAARQPSRYVDLALALGPDHDRWLRSGLLTSMATRDAPADSPEDAPPWVPLADDVLAQVVSRDVFLLEPACARGIGWIVRDRPEFAWPSVVLRRLEEIARGEAPDQAARDFDGLAFDRLNEDGCVALQALAENAERQPGLRPRVLNTARGLVQHPNPGRRASAAMAAWSCRAYDRAAALEAFFLATEDVVVAAENDVHRVLLHLACREGAVREERSEARARLLGLRDGETERIAKIAGTALLILRWHEVIDDGEVIEHSRSVAVRTGLAQAVSRHLPSDEAGAWLEELAISLASDRNDPVAEAIAFTFARPGADRLLQNQSLVARLVETRALRSWPERFLRACDKQNLLTLESVREHVLVLAHAIAAGEESPKTWTRWDAVGKACGLLARLAEEAERIGDLELRSRALDAWDALLESGQVRAMSELERRWIEI